MIYLISCGSKKNKNPCAAKDMYIGTLFKAALAYARKRSPEYKIFIISAKYGILRLADIIYPYNEKMAVNGSVTSDMVYKQANIMGIDKEEITVLAGKAYVDFIKESLPEAKIHTPLQGKSLGYSIQFLKRGY